MMNRIAIMTWLGLAFVCFGCKSDDATKTQPDRLSKRGESCLSTNDCASSLACIRNVCTDADFKIGVGAKVCVQVDCATSSDCCGEVPAACANFEETYANYCEPYMEPNCYSSYSSCVDSSDCLTAGEECDPSLGYCVCAENPNYDYSNPACTGSLDCTPCSYTCSNERCVAACTSDLQCGSGTCDVASGACIECEEDADCFGSEEKCVAHACVVPCKQNENCPLFHACDAASGECLYAGCADDHECQFAYPSTETQDGKASVCVQNDRASEEGQPARVCRVPCVSDAECGRNELCQNGGCVYMGCKTDEECRAELNLANYPAGAAFTPKAVCRSL